MCLIVFSYKTHPQYPLILAANRDELYNRPTRKAQFWEEEPEILAGKDLKGGGTWLGVSKERKIAALTNYRDIESIKENAPTRGNIIKDFLTEGSSSERFLQGLQKTGDQYNGFNLIAGSVNNLFYYSNQKNSYSEISPGIHSISNAFLDTPWPKTEAAARSFREKTAAANPKEEELFELLCNTDQYPDKELPKTGLPAEMERAVSAIFIKMPGYGTRCSTLVFVDNQQRITFVERTFLPGTTEPNSTVRYII